MKNLINFLTISGNSKYFSGLKKIKNKKSNFPIFFVGWNPNIFVNLESMQKNVIFLGNLEESLRERELMPRKCHIISSLVHALGSDQDHFYKPS
jgi:hypothetical protein